MINLIFGKSLVKAFKIKLSAHLNVFALEGGLGLSTDGIDGGDVQDFMFESTALRNIREF